MGGRTSKKADDAKYADNVGWPWQKRQYVLQTIREAVKGDDNNLLKENLQVLNEVFGLNNTDEDNEPKEDSSFLIDKCGNELALQLCRVVKSGTPGWKEETDALCRVLLTHVRPPDPKCMGRLPNSQDVKLTHICVTGVDLHDRPKEITALATVITRNPGLKTIELAYTGLDVSEFLWLLSTLQKLKFLSYIGLRGNRLDSRIFPQTIQILKKRNSFTSLLWIDLRNNFDIFTLPRNVLLELQKHWPKDGYLPTFRELSDGKAVIVDGEFIMNV